MLRCKTDDLRLGSGPTEFKQSTSIKISLTLIFESIKIVIREGGNS
jgi:hypothetical protein